MNETPEPRSAARPSRRTIARGAAWSVPVVAVGAAAPAFAASGGTGSVTGACGSGPNGSISVSVTGTAAQFVQVTFTHSGSGSITSITPPPGATSCGTNCYLLPVSGGSASGTFTVNQSIGQNGTGTVTATITSSPGSQTISGDTTGFFSKRRDGNSSNYTCEGSG